MSASSLKVVESTGHSKEPDPLKLTVPLKLFETVNAMVKSIGIFLSSGEVHADSMVRNEARYTSSTGTRIRLSEDCGPSISPLMLAEKRLLSVVSETGERKPGKMPISSSSTECGI